jgi:hypothetical protein
LGASFPSFATFIFAITCFIVGGLQPLGFIGVMRVSYKLPLSVYDKQELDLTSSGKDQDIQDVYLARPPRPHCGFLNFRSSHYRLCTEPQERSHYLYRTCSPTVTAIGASLLTDLQANYYKPKSTASASATTMLTQQAPLICNPFAWAGIGIMGGLWVVLFLLQMYFM